MLLCPLQTRLYNHILPQITFKAQQTKSCQCKLNIYGHYLLRVLCDTAILSRVSQDYSWGSECSLCVLTESTLSLGSNYCLKSTDTWSPNSEWTIGNICVCYSNVCQAAFHHHGEPGFVVEQLLGTKNGFLRQDSWDSKCCHSLTDFPLVRDQYDTGDNLPWRTHQGTSIPLCKNFSYLPPPTAAGSTFSSK